MCFYCPRSSFRALSCQSPLPLEPRAGLSRNCSRSGTGSDGRRQESQSGGERRFWLALKATDEASGREAFSQNFPLPCCSSADGQGTRPGCQGSAKAEAGLWFSTCSVKEVNQCSVLPPSTIWDNAKGNGSVWVENLKCSQPVSDLVSIGTKKASGLWFAFFGEPAASFCYNQDNLSLLCSSIHQQ